MLGRSIAAFVTVLIGAKARRRLSARRTTLRAMAVVIDTTRG
jgi:hypothetical protein